MKRKRRVCFTNLISFFFLFVGFILCDSSLPFSKGKRLNFFLRNKFPPAGLPLANVAPIFIFSYNKRKKWYRRSIKVKW